MTRRLHVRRLSKRLQQWFRPRSHEPHLAETAAVDTDPTAGVEKYQNFHQESKEIIDKTVFNLWERAEQKLYDDPEKKQLLESVYETLRSELGAELQPIGTPGRQAQLNALFQRKADALQKEKWRIQFGDHQVLVQDLVNRAFQKVLMVKELINTAASASPPAALACAGLSVVFTLALQATQQDAILLQILEYTSGVICRFQVMEDIYRSDMGSSKVQSQHQADLAIKFEDHLTDVYVAILDFQARALHYLQKNSVVRLLGDAFDHEGWTSILQGIKDLEISTEKDAQAIGAATVDRRLRAIQDAQAHNEARQMMLEQDKAARQLLKALYTCPYKDRKDRNDERVPGTCEWFTTHRLFQNWHHTEGSSLLWVSADPGCGKSVLSKYLVDALLPVLKGSTTICYFFFKDDFPNQRTATHALCAVLRQIFLAKPHLLQDPILYKFDMDGERLTESFKDLWSIFTSIVADPSAGETICVLDAVDECEDEGRKELIEAIMRFHLGGSGNGNVKFLVTSRPYSHIHRDFQGMQEDLSTIHLSGEGEEEVEQIMKEINLVTQKRVEDIGRERHLSPEQRQLLLDELMPVPNRTYLWVTLTMDVIRSTPGFTRGNIRTAISQIPRTVNDAYEKILSRSPAPERAKIILHAIIAATRPMSVSEMAIVVAANQAIQSSSNIEDYLETQETFQQTLREICGLFVVVMHSHVYLLHQTAREFLVRPVSPSLLEMKSPTTTWKSSIGLEDSNRILAEVCTWYLASPDRVRGFTEYSTNNWIVHFKACDIEAEDSITRWASRLSDLMSAYFSGLTPIIEYLIRVEKVDVNSKTFPGRTILAHAAQDGRVEVVHLILDYATGITSRKSYYALPLWLAVACGHADVVQLLLDHGADPNLVNGVGDVPLGLAARLGDERVVELLINHGADVNIRDAPGQTPLSLAAGNENICKLLLDNGAEAC